MRRSPPLMVSLMLCVGGLAGCSFGAPPSLTQRDTLAACQRQAEAMYRLRHRDQIYGVGNQDAPQSGAVGLTLPTAGLADRYEQETFIQGCVHDTGTGTALQP